MAFYFDHRVSPLLPFVTIFTFPPENLVSPFHKLLRAIVAVFRWMKHCSHFRVGDGHIVFCACEFTSR